MIDYLWGDEAGAGVCDGCEEQAEETERHHYSLPEAGTVALCLECGPEENYQELEAARLQSVRSAHND